MTTKKLLRYAASCLLCAVGIYAVGTVLSKRFQTFLECFIIESLGLFLFHHGLKLGLLTYDPDIETLGDRRREAWIKKRVAAILRTRTEREQAEGN